MTTATADRTVKGASTKTNYDNLPFLPNLIGETVATQPYTEAEFSEGLRQRARHRAHRGCPPRHDAGGCPRIRRPCVTPAAVWPTPPTQGG